MSGLESEWSGNALGWEQADTSWHSNTLATLSSTGTDSTDAELVMPKIGTTGGGDAEGFKV